jgi:hypothetical protein
VGKPERIRAFGKRIILQPVVKKFYLRAWIGFVWLRIGTNGGLL